MQFFAKGSNLEESFQMNSVFKDGGDGIDLGGLAAQFCGTFLHEFASKNFKSFVGGVGMIPKRGVRETAVWDGIRPGLVVFVGFDF